MHQDLGIITEAWSPIGRESGLRDHPPIVVQIAQRTAKSPAQVLLRWHVQQGIVPIPQAAKPAWLVENISVFDFSLTAEEMAALARLDRGENAARDSDSPPKTATDPCRTHPYLARRVGGVDVDHKMRKPLHDRVDLCSTD